MEAECFRRKSRSGRIKATIVLVTALALLICFVIHISINMRTAMATLASARIKSLAARAMNDAILESMSDQDTYSQLIDVRDTGSHVYMLQANTRNMNLLAAECSEAAQARIAALGEQGISVPLGTITGITFFSGKGPRISVSFSPVGSVQSAFDSEFISSGINQTLYRVNLHLTASIKLVMPGISETIQIVSQVAIAENILVGDVPQVYTDVANKDDMLNLIPTEVPAP
ncbi:MAG: sporulation protein YunB [Clostridia bacterium]